MRRWQKVVLAIPMTVVTVFTIAAAAITGWKAVFIPLLDEDRFAAISWDNTFVAGVCAIIVAIAVVAIIIWGWSTTFKAMNYNTLRATRLARIEHQASQTQNTRPDPLEILDNEIRKNQLIQLAVLYYREKGVNPFSCAAHLASSYSITHGASDAIAELGLAEFRKETAGATPALSPKPAQLC